MSAVRVTFTLVDGGRHFTVELDDLELAIEERNDLQVQVVTDEVELGADPRIMHLTLTRPMGGGVARQVIGRLGVAIPVGDALALVNEVCRGTAFLDYLARVLQHFLRQQGGGA